MNNVRVPCVWVDQYHYNELIQIKVVPGWRTDLSWEKTFLTEQNENSLLFDCIVTISVKAQFHEMSIDDNIK